MKNKKKLILQSTFAILLISFFVYYTLLVNGVRAATPTPSPTYLPSMYPTATATPMPTPTATPLPTSTPTPQLTSTPTPTLTPTPTPAPTKTPEPAVSTGGSSSESSSHDSYKNLAPIGTPDLFQITRNGDTVILYFTPVQGNTESYHIVYGYEAGNPLFGRLSVPRQNDNWGVQSVEISALDPSKNYSFSVAPVSGETVGNWSNWLEAKSEGVNFYRWE